MICSDPSMYRPPIYVLVLRNRDDETWVTEDATFDDQQTAAQVGKDSLGSVYDAWMVLGSSGLTGTVTGEPASPVAAYVSSHTPKKLRTEAEWREHLRELVPRIGAARDITEADGFGTRITLKRVVRQLIPKWPEFRVTERSKPGRNRMPMILFELARVAA